MIWLYDAQRVGAFDQSTFDYVYEQFAQDFGGLRPYIVREDQWYQPNARRRARDPDGRHVRLGRGGVRLQRRIRAYTIAEVGPGFNNTRLGDGPNRFNTDRQDGAFFRDGLEQALTSGRRIVAVETWNEFGEGTGILEDAGIRPAIHRHPAQLCRSAQRPRAACWMKSWLAGSIIDCNPTYRNSTPSST